MENLKAYLKDTYNEFVYKTTWPTFSDLQKILPSSVFKRVHKSYMVSVNKIDSIQRNIVVIGKERIPISATYKDDFYRFINIIEN